MAADATSCGVVVTDGTGRVLLGQATGSARWDIPKGVAEPGERFADAAVRELREETGLVAEPAGLRALGVHRYLPGKDLALFAWTVPEIEVGALRCTSLFRARDGRMVPELARFVLLDWEGALGRVGKNLGRVLRSVGAPAPSPGGEGV